MAALLAAFFGLAAFLEALAFFALAGFLAAFFAAFSGFVSGAAIFKNTIMIKDRAVAVTTTAPEGA